MATTKLKRFRSKNTSSTTLNNFATFDQIGGLENHINVLKETILFPLTYEKVYKNFHLKVPRGVLFYGPPGTGKTLMAGALARECQGVTFYHRKAADILDKWIGSSEQRIRDLFKKAAMNRPAIIFFDELDGLAPTRSSRNDQVHAAIVTTLLSLMDGLETAEGVIVIGATNRIDSIDPALRRPGRFDRELYFGLPDVQARKEILEICVRSWKSKPSDSFLSHLAEITTGYSGSDLQGLCSEAVLCCLRRIYPNVHSIGKVNVNLKCLNVNEKDFVKAKNLVSPLTHRLSIPLRKLHPVMRPLLQQQLDTILAKINHRWPHFGRPHYKYSSGCVRYSGILLLTGMSNQGQSMHVAPAILQALEHLPSHIIDIQALFQTSNRTAEEICIQYVSQARRSYPAIVLLYRMDEWWHIVEETTRAVVLSLLNDTHPHIPTLTIATISNGIPDNLKECFSNNGVMRIKMRNPNQQERKEFLSQLFIQKGFKKLFNYDISTEKKSEEFHNDSEISCNVTEQESNCSEVESLKRKRSSTICVNRKKLQRNDSEELQNTSSENVVKETRTDVSVWAIDKAMDFIHKSITTLTGQIEEPPAEGPNINPQRDDIKTLFVNKKSLHTEDNLRLPNIENLPMNIKGPANRLYYLFKRSYIFTTNGMTAGQLETFYDRIYRCMSQENKPVFRVLDNIEKIIKDKENKKSEVHFSHSGSN